MVVTTREASLLIQGGRICGIIEGASRNSEELSIEKQMCLKIIQDCLNAVFKYLTKKQNKKITLEKIYSTLKSIGTPEEIKYQVKVPSNIAQKALLSIDKMIEYS